MDRIVVFATAWGPREGGINAFNTDLCVGLRQAVPGMEIVCVIVGPSAADTAAFDTWQAEALEAGVHLVAVFSPSDRGAPAPLLLDGLRHRDIAAALYVGHDLFTGWWAVEVARRVGAPSFVLVHMAPENYKAFVGDDGDKVWELERQQKALFLAADHLGGVGPRLFEHARKKIPVPLLGKAVELIPGLADIELKTPPSTSFVGITVGRLSPKDDLLKQGQLALRSFARAVRALGEDHDHYDIGFRAIGLSSDRAAYDQERENLEEMAKAIAGRRIQVLGNRFNEDREHLFSTLGEQNVFYMLSLHEGFGLAGFEAIAAGVPLVLSKRSGLFDFLKARKLLGFVSTVHLVGDGLDSDSTDQAQVAESTERILFDGESARATAGSLRHQLIQLDTTWRRCAEDLLRACGMGDRLPASRPAPPADRDDAPAKPWPWSGLGDEAEASVRQALAWLMDGRERFAELDGPLTERKRRVVDRLAQMVSWDLGDVYRLKVVRVPEAPSAGALARLADTWPSRPRPGDRPPGPLLLVIDPPPDADAVFWRTLTERADAAGAFVLLTAPGPSALDLPPQRRRIAWAGEPPTDTGAAWGFGFSPAIDPTEEEALRRVSATAFGLSLGELFELLSGEPEDDRYAFVQRLVDGDIDRLAHHDGRWVCAAPTASEHDEALARHMAALLAPKVDAAVEASRLQRWPLLRALLPSALEGIVQQARAGEPDLAFERFDADLFEPTLFRFARFDRLLKVLENFFSDTGFGTCRLSDPRLARKARANAAQALANLGRVDEAWALHTAVLASPAAEPLLASLQVNAAFSSFLAGRYEDTEALLQSALRDPGLSRRRRAVAHRSLAKLHLREMRLDLATAELASAHELYAAEDDAQGLAGVEAYRAELAIAQGRPALALDIVEAGFERLDALERRAAARWDSRDRVRLLLARGKALSAAAPHGPEARRTAGEAMAGALETGAIDFVIDAHVLVARSLEPHGVDEAQVEQLHGIAGQADRDGLRRHAADVRLAIAAIDAGRGRTESAARLARRVHEAARLDGGLHQDEWLRRAAARMLPPTAGDAVR
jgi:glycosyltransferase involved in cell wall biosynthesis/tetratricopeptide (TPR) repeat protein